MVHLYGHPCDMEAFKALCERHGLALIEDAAHTPGAEYRERRVGSFGIGCFSSYATKNLTAGEGGMVITHDLQLAWRLRMLRDHGQSAKYVHSSGPTRRPTWSRRNSGPPPISRMRLIGVLDPRHPMGSEVMPGLPVLGTLEDLPRYIEQLGVREVNASASTLPREALVELFCTFAFHPQVTLRLSSGLYELLATGTEVLEVMGVPLLCWRLRLSPLERALKRTMDLDPHPPPDDPGRPPQARGLLGASLNLPTMGIADACGRHPVRRATLKGQRSKHPRGCAAGTVEPRRVADPDFQRWLRRGGFPEPVAPAVFEVLVYPDAELIARRLGVGLYDAKRGEIAPPPLAPVEG